MRSTWPLVLAVGAVTGMSGAFAAWLFQPSAWNECVAHGEEIRAALEAHRATTGKYPADLEALPDHVPLCREWPGGTILSYRPSPRTYTLSFSDRFGGHYATETEPFMAHQ